ncbi:hypothetical protein Taro_040127 [Colocasia esculenta]|uniref:Uncharacterized protein n=1 Tax=Colocasia esculenta TaxID=4460 RepID=A0A843WTJ1_COLES|nr:hypothetical protein [Colocasia esculenta]
MATRTMFLTSLFLVLLFLQLGGHSPTLAHEGSRLLPSQITQHTQLGSNATARWEEGWKGRQEDAGDIEGFVGDDGDGKLLKRSGKTSSGGGSGPGGGRSGGRGSGGNGGHNGGGGETALRPGRNRGAAGSIRALMVTGPAQGVILMLLSTILFPV